MGRSHGGGGEGASGTERGRGGGHSNGRLSSSRRTGSDAVDAAASLLAGLSLEQPPRPSSPPSPPLPLIGRRAAPSLAPKPAGESTGSSAASATPPAAPEPAAPATVASGGMVLIGRRPGAGSRAGDASAAAPSSAKSNPVESPTSSSTLLAPRTAATVAATEASTGHTATRRLASSPASSVAVDGLVDSLASLSLASLSLASTPAATSSAAPITAPAAPSIAPAESSLAPLRDYQAAIVADIEARFRAFWASRRATAHADGASSPTPPLRFDRKRQSLMLYLPTGAGKTRVASELVRSITQRGLRSLFVVNRNKLVDQTAAAFAAQGLRSSDLVSHDTEKDTACLDAKDADRAPLSTPSSSASASASASASSSAKPPVVGFIKAGRPEHRERPVQIASIQSLSARVRAAKRAALAVTRGGRTAEERVREDDHDADDVDEAEEGREEDGVGDGDASDEEEEGADEAAAEKEKDAASFPPADFVVIDEAHGAVSASYATLLHHYRRNGTFVLGLSATPCRLERNEDLGVAFERLLLGPPVAELIRRRILARPLVIACDQAKVARLMESAKLVPKPRQRRRRQHDDHDDHDDHDRGGDNGVATAAGPRRPGGAPRDRRSRGDVDSDDDEDRLEYRRSDLARIFSDPSLVESVVDQWKERCVGRRTICFAVDIAHSKSVAEAFRRRGVPAAHVDGETPETTRERLFDDLAAGRLLVLSSVNVLSEGFDEPRIGAVLLLRPTHSRALYIQQIGRGLRSFPGKKTCIVLDQAGNTLRHGSVVGPPGYALETFRSDRTDRIVLPEQAGEGVVGSGASAAAHAASAPLPSSSPSSSTAPSSASSKATDAARRKKPRVVLCPQPGCGCLSNRMFRRCEACGADLMPATAASGTPREPEKGGPGAAGGAGSAREADGAHNARGTKGARDASGGAGGAGPGTKSTVSAASIRTAASSALSVEARAGPPPARTDPSAASGKRV